jgi:hypothetical protein
LRTGSAASPMVRISRNRDEMKEADDDFQIRNGLEAKVLEPPNFGPRWLMKNPYLIKVVVLY